LLRPPLEPPQSCAAAPTSSWFHVHHEETVDSEILARDGGHDLTDRLRCEVFGIREELGCSSLLVRVADSVNHGLRLVELDVFRAMAGKDLLGVRR
jgi:hypothetical protein